MAKLFETIEVGGLRLANRIVIAPMCQYSAVDGAMTDWHQMHLGELALSGAGALTIEATAVSPEGRITYGDVGLYDDRTEAAMRSVLESVRRWMLPVTAQVMMTFSARFMIFFPILSREPSLRRSVTGDREAKRYSRSREPDVPPLGSIDVGTHCCPPDYECFCRFSADHSAAFWISPSRAASPAMIASMILRAWRRP